jgi:phage shock protein C
MKPSGPCIVERGRRRVKERGVPEGRPERVLWAVDGVQGIAYSAIADSGNRAPWKERKMTETVKKRLYRSEKDRRIAGVCGGLANYMDADPTLVRLITVLLGVVTGIAPFVIAYLVAILIVPLEPQTGTTAQ